MFNTLNPKQREVLQALVKDSEGNGHDFGIIENIKYANLGLTGQQFGAYFTQLNELGAFSSVDRVKVNGKDWITQYAFSDKAKTELKI